MIKKFFAKLTGWNPYKHREWEKMMASKGQEISRLAEGLAQDRKTMEALEREKEQRHLDEDERVTARKYDKAA